MLYSIHSSDVVENMELASLCFITCRMFEILQKFSFACHLAHFVKCNICVVLTSDQWKLVTTSDPLKAIVVPNAKHESYN